MLCEIAKFFLSKYFYFNDTMNITTAVLFFLLYRVNHQSTPAKHLVLHALIMKVSNLFLSHTYSTFEPSLLMMWCHSHSIRWGVTSLLISWWSITSSHYQTNSTFSSSVWCCGEYINLRTFGSMLCRHTSWYITIKNCFKKYKTKHASFFFTFSCSPRDWASF